MSSISAKQQIEQCKMYVVSVGHEGVVLLENNFTLVITSCELAFFLAWFDPLYFGEVIAQNNILKSLVQMEFPFHITLSNHGSSLCLTTSILFMSNTPLN